LIKQLFDFHGDNNGFYAFDSLDLYQRALGNGSAVGRTGGPLHGAQLDGAGGGHVVNVCGDVALGADDGIHIGSFQLGGEMLSDQRPQAGQQQGGNCQGGKNLKAPAGSGGSNRQRSQTASCKPEGYHGDGGSF